MSDRFDAARDRVTGRHRFAIHEDFPTQLHAAVVRSTLPHARIAEIRRPESDAMSEVVAILTSSDLPSSHYEYMGNPHPILAVDRVRYVGEPVAIVLAESIVAARAAAELVEVDYEMLAAVTSLGEALSAAEGVRPDAPDGLAAEYSLSFGDVEKAWSQAFKVYDDVYTSPTAHHVPLEPHVCMVRPSDEGLEIISATQSPYTVRSVVAAAFSLPEDSVRVRVPSIGGAFGSKDGIHLEPLVAAAALAVGRPVRLELSRDEVFLTVVKHAARVRLRTGVDAEGRLLVRSAEVLWNVGAYADDSTFAVGQGLIRSIGPYRIPNVEASSKGYLTNTVPCGAFRGAMTSQLCWAYESQMDDIARDLGVDPFEYRKLHLLQDGDTFATGEVMKDVHFTELASDAWTSLKKHVLESTGKALPREGRWLRGQGLAVMMKSTITPSRSEARLRVCDDGRIAVYSSTVDMGQGRDVALTTLVAQELGVDPAMVDASPVDSERTPFDTTTASSRSTFTMSVAIRDACADLVAKAVELAAQTTGRDDWTCEAPLRLRCADRELPLAKLLAEAELDYLDGFGEFQSTGGLVRLSDGGSRDEVTAHWHQAALAVDLEVDTETGSIRLLNCVGRSFAGRIVDHERVQQQNEGSILFGLGPALYEELVFDDGQPVNLNMSDYCIPGFAELPSRLDTRSHESVTSEEVHGVGEMLVPVVAPAIGNAIRMAVGSRVRDLPMSAERVLTQIGGSGTEMEHK